MEFRSIDTPELQGKDWVHFKQCRNFHTIYFQQWRTRGVGRSFGCHNCMTNCCRNGEELELQPDCQTALHFFLKTLFCHCDVAQNIFMMDGCKYNRIHVASMTVCA